MPLLLDHIRVVIADDSDFVRFRLRDLLREHGARVVGEADNANTAVDLVNKVEPDAVVLDIEMPGNGIKALKKIRKQHPQTKVIMLTNHAEPYFKQMCLNAGAAFFMDKSLEFERVPEALAA
ncbi:MAG: response regulator transcription factor [Bacteroidota bacterium]